ncbi:ELM1/GtrOC1 family putative glycosyltransferase [Azotobacter chroococcum]
MIDSLDGWRTLLRRVALRYPDRCWQLDCQDRQGRTHRFRADFAQRSRGGQVLPRVWVLQGGRAGDNAQLTDIAEALGWPYEIKRPESLASAGATDAWPDLVLSAGRHTAVVARRIQRQSQGHARLVVLGRPRAPLADFDRVVTTPQYGLPLRQNVVDLPAPSSASIPSTRRRWKPGGSVSPICRGRGSRCWWAATASLPARRTDRCGAGPEAGAAARARGGSLLLSTSPRTSAGATDALLAAIDAPLWSYRFGSQGDNPYRALLALADAFVVTGESVSMLTEACMSGRPVAVFPCRCSGTARRGCIMSSNGGWASSNGSPAAAACRGSRAGSGASTTNWSRRAGSSANAAWSRYTRPWAWRLCRRVWITCRDFLRRCLPPPASAPSRRSARSCKRSAPFLERQAPEAVSARAPPLPDRPQPAIRTSA